MKLKIVKNNKVKRLPKEKSTVKAALLRAIDDARTDKWDKVFIVGGRKDGTKYSTRHTSNSDLELLGLIEIAKSIIYKDA